MSGRDVVYVSSIDWSFLWQVHQEIAVRLARAGHRVFYVENTGVRAPGPGDAERVAQRLSNFAHASRERGWRTVAPAIRALAPLVLPPFSGPLVRAINRRLLLPALVRGAKQEGLSPERLLWTFLPTDTALDLVGQLRTPGSVLVYYCLADFEQLTPHPAALRAVEDQLLLQADLVFANSPLMVRRCRRVRDQVELVPPGIDLGAFPAPAGISAITAGGGTAAPPAPPEIDPADEQLLRSLPRPVIGYVGGLHRFVDFALLTAAARSRPGWSFVLVGPRQPGAEAMGDLAFLPNVRLLGPRPHQRLAGLIGAFDVGIIPYLVSPASESLMPIKLNEYLAMGRPVAATALPPLLELAAREGVIEVSASGSESFLAAIERALESGTDPAAQARRRQVAERTDWDALFAGMAALIDERFAALGKGPRGGRSR